MPSHRAHAFQVLSQHALPRLLDVKALARNEVAITYGEEMLYQPLDGLISWNEYFLMSTHFLCVFHLTARGPLAELKPSTKRQHAGMLGEAYIELRKSWIWS